VDGISLQEVLELLPPNSIKILTGKENLKRLVTGVTLIETPDVGNWVRGGELLLTTGYIFKDHPQQLLELVKQLHNKKAAALGIKLNRYLDSLPEEILNIAKELKFPVFTILTEKPAFIDIISKVYERLEEQKALQQAQDKLLDNFLKEIFLQDLSAKRELVTEEALLYKISLDKPKAIFLLKGSLCKDEVPVYKRLSYEVTGSRFLTLYRSDKLALLVEFSPERATKEVAFKTATSLQQSYKNKYPDKHIEIGISRFYTDLFKLPLALVEAEKCLTIGKAVWPKQKLFHYEDMGFYRLIVNQTKLEELKAFYQDTLEPLVSYDKDNQTSLVSTLEEYLKHSGNITLTAQDLFVHYNTVKYRIGQIEELLGTTLKDAEVRFNLQVALKIRRLLAD